MGATEILEVITGVLLRLLLPAGITILVAGILKRLDDRWRLQSLNEALAAAGASRPVQELQCWEAFGCTPERQAACKAARDSSRPCWECFRVNGRLQASCKRCAFRQLKVSAAASA